MALSPRRLLSREVPEEGCAGLCSQPGPSAPIGASFPELGSSSVGPAPTHLRGLRSFPQPPAAASVAVLRKEPAGNTSPAVRTYACGCDTAARELCAGGWPGSSAKPSELGPTELSALIHGNMLPSLPGPLPLWLQLCLQPGRGSFPAPACSAGRPAHTLPTQGPHVGGRTRLSDGPAEGLGSCTAWGPNSASKDGNTVLIRI